MGTQLGGAVSEDEAPEIELDAEVAEGIDEPQGDDVEDEMAEEALGEVAPEQEEAPALPPGPAPFPIEDFASTLKDALAPLVPKPAVEKKWWDDPKTMREQMLRDPEKFHRSIHEFTDHKVKTALEPIHGSMQKMVEIVQHLMARSQERPGFSQAASKATEMSKKYGIPYNQALRITLDNEGKPGPKPAQSGKKVRIPPGHASAPDTSQSTARVARDKGPADFGDIVKSLRGSVRK